MTGLLALLLLVGALVSAWLLGPMFTQRDGER